MLQFQRKSLSCESAWSYLQAFTKNSHLFLWKRNSLFQHFNSECEVNGMFLDILNAVVSEKITFLWKCLKLLTSIQQKFTYRAKLCILATFRRCFPEKGNLPHNVSEFCHKKSNKTESKWYDSARKSNVKQDLQRTGKRVRVMKWLKKN